MFRCWFHVVIYNLILVFIDKMLDVVDEYKQHGPLVSCALSRYRGRTSQVEHRSHAHKSCSHFTAERNQNIDRKSEGCF